MRNSVRVAHVLGVLFQGSVNRGFQTSGSEKGVFWKRGLSREVLFLEILEILENSQTVEKKGESDHFLEISGMN